MSYPPGPHSIKGRQNQQLQVVTMVRTKLYTAKREKCVLIPNMPMHQDGGELNPQLCQWFPQGQPGPYI